MERRFALRLKSLRSNIEIIVCKEEALEIEVIPSPSGQPGNMTMVVILAGAPVHFNITGDIQPNWDRPLFVEAINWFLVNQMQLQPTALTGLEHFQPNRWIDEEDGFEETEPLSEEERQWQQYTCDEQRKHDVSVSVEAVLKNNLFVDSYSNGI